MRLCGFLYIEGSSDTMHTFIIRRILALLPTLIFTSIIVFASIRLIPGDVIDLMLAQNDISTGNDRAVIEAALGLDKPIYMQYFLWVGDILQGDLGRSLWQNTPVTEQLALTLPITFELGALALIVALSVAIPIGIYSAMKQDTMGDYIARSFSLLMLAIPSFWLGTLVMVFHRSGGAGRQKTHAKAFSRRPVGKPCTYVCTSSTTWAFLICGDHANDAHDDVRSTAAGLHQNSEGKRFTGKHRCSAPCIT